MSHLGSQSLTQHPYNILSYVAKELFEWPSRRENGPDNALDVIIGIRLQVLDASIGTALLVVLFRAL